MELDKIIYLSMACFTGFLVILIIILGNYGSNISKEPNFIMFFRWYIFLLVLNLINIMITFIFHYIMVDIPGVKGLKGFTGDKGLSGENNKCFCEPPTDKKVTDIKNLDINRDIKTRDVNNMENNRVGTLIYHDNDDNNNTPLSFDKEHKYAPS